MSKFVSAVRQFEKWEKQQKQGEMMKKKKRNRQKIASLGFLFSEGDTDTLDRVPKF